MKCRFLWPEAVSRRAFVRLAARLSLVFAFAAVAIAPASARQASDDLETRGDQLAAAFDNAGAIEAYALALERLGDQAGYELRAKLVHVTVDRGMDLAWARDLEAAEPVIARGMELAQALKADYPERAETWLLLAIANGSAAQFRSGREKVRAGWDIESYCKEAIRLDPSFSLPYIALGKFYGEIAGLNWFIRQIAQALYGRIPKGSYEQSLEMLDRAIELDPDVSIAHYERGVTLYHMKRDAEAEAAWRRALELPPMTTRDVHHNRRIQRTLGLQ